MGQSGDQVKAYLDDIFFRKKVKIVINFRFWKLNMPDKMSRVITKGIETEYYFQSSKRGKK